MRLVAVTATGYNNVDLEAARAAGVTVSNVAGYAGDTVPQHAFALILNLATKAYRYAADVERGDWQRSSSFTLLRYPTFELKGLDHRHHRLRGDRARRRAHRGGIRDAGARP